MKGKIAFEQQRIWIGKITRYERFLNFVFHPNEGDKQYLFFMVVEIGGINLKKHHCSNGVISAIRDSKEYLLNFPIVLQKKEKIKDEQKKRGKNHIHQVMPFKVVQQILNG